MDAPDNVASDYLEAAFGGAAKPPEVPIAKLRVKPTTKAALLEAIREIRRGGPGTPAPLQAAIDALPPQRVIYRLKRDGVEAHYDALVAAGAGEAAPSRRGSDASVESLSEGVSATGQGSPPRLKRPASADRDGAGVPIAIARQMAVFNLLLVQAVEGATQQFQPGGYYIDGAATALRDPPTFDATVDVMREIVADTEDSVLVSVAANPYARLAVIVGTAVATSVKKTEASPPSSAPPS